MTDPAMTDREVLAGISRLRVLVVGDVALDRWCHYDPALADPSRETGLSRIAVISSECTPGAAGTVASNVAALGAHATLLSAIGRDGHGFELKAALCQRAIEHRLAEWPGFATFTYTKLINSQSGIEDLPRVDFVNTQPPAPELESEIVREFERLAPQADVILVSDQAETSAGGVVTSALRQSLRHTDALVWVDSRLRSELFRGVIVKGNRAEMEAASGRALGRIDFAALRHAIHAPLLVITDGPRGATVVSDTGSQSVATRPVANPVDICGAGDSFSAAAALALKVTGDASAAMRFGHLAASISIMKKGTGTASAAEMLAAAMLN